MFFKQLDNIFKTIKFTFFFNNSHFIIKKIRKKKEKKFSHKLKK